MKRYSHREKYLFDSESNNWSFFPIRFWQLSDMTCSQLYQNPSVTVKCNCLVSGDESPQKYFCSADGRVALACIRTSAHSLVGGKGGVPRFVVFCIFTWNLASCHQWSRFAYARRDVRQVVANAECRSLLFCCAFFSVLLSPRNPLRSRFVRVFCLQLLRLLRRRLCFLLVVFHLTFRSPRSILPE